ncbi:MAG: HupE/UreJ family protein [Alphaproteobacteria bacterium]|nr:HupE/UreJ family protein [Alphaproteobacteria bacterium]
MSRPSLNLPWMVCCFVLMSSCFMGVFGITGQVWGHEMRPAVAQVTVTQSNIEIALRLTAETVLAGIDQSRVSDTNEAPEAVIYERLRALSDQALADLIKQRWPELQTGLLLVGAGAADLVRVDVIAEPNLDLPRDTLILLQAELTAGQGPVSFGWVAENGALVVRHGSGADAYAAFLEGGKMSAPLPRLDAMAETMGAVFLRFVMDGIEHIIPKGLDHILFVLGLFLFSRAWRPLLAQISAFTLAHTVTLGLATLSIITIPATQMWLVEALIAVSIAYVAIENILGPKMRWWRIAVVFGFGLLHGLGFASVLSELGLVQGQFILSLVAFNMGVELGQLGVIAVAFLILTLPFDRGSLHRNLVVIPVSVAIAMVGLWWAIERSFF